jgi:TonB-dependent starch-binding outer membrane protein SusC
MQFTRISKVIVQKRRANILTLLVCFLVPAACLFAQTITLSLKEQPIEKAIKGIEEQTALRFIYSQETIHSAKPVSVQLVKASLQEALDKLFTGQPLSYSLEDGYIMVKKKELTSTVSFDVTGRVMDEDGRALAGVTVMDERSSRSTFTGEHGEFVFKGLDERAILIFSYVGRETVEVPLAGRNFISVRLHTVSKTLDETIVQAYGTTTRRLNTGTISKVSADMISKQPVSNPIAALEGRVAGLQITQGSGMPGSFYTIRLRGQNSIANGNDPLIIIDGVPFPSTTLNGSFGGGGGVTNSPLNTIDPSQIASIEVLKDADATAIYGSRGANGVILITTKRGTAGSTSVNVSSYTGWGKIQRRLDLLKTPDYLQLRREAFANDGTIPTTANARDLLVWDTTRYTDWQRELIGNTMHVYDAKASVADGNQQTRFLLGLGYHKETTVMPMDFGEEKFSGNFNLDHKSISGRLGITVNGSFLKDNNKLPQSDISSNITLPPDAPKLFDSTGNLNWENSTWTNPYSLLLKTFSTTTDNLIFHTVVGYRILSTLDFKTTISFNRLSQTEHINLPISSNNPAFASSGTAGFGNNTINTSILEPQLNFHRSLLKGNLALLAGYTIQSTWQNAIYQIGSGYTSDDLLNSLKAAPSLSISNEIRSVYRYLGAFGRINYDYQNKYFATATLRRDGSSRYGPANRFATFGSLGLAWNFSKEKFFRLPHFISYGKFKGSVGVTGNDQIGDYKFLDTYSSYIYSYLGVVPLQPTQLFNPDFGWERVVKSELGLDLGLAGDLLLISLNYYHNTTTNQLISYALPVVTGFSGVLKNLPARILNSGFEAEVTASLVTKKNFNWSASLNFSLPKNKLISFEHIERSTYANTYIIGQSLFIARKYLLQGVDPQSGNYLFQDVNKDGKITVPEDLAAVVFTGQQYFGGLQNTINFKKAGLSFLFQFVRQKNGSNYVARFSKPGTMSNQPTFIMTRWRAPGDEALYQKFSNSNSANNIAFSNYSSSDAAYSDASFVRLKSIEFSWQAFSGKAEKPKQVVLFIQGQNIITVSRYRGLDPETKSVMPPLTMAVIGFRSSF